MPEPAAALMAAAAAASPGPGPAVTGMMISVCSLDSAGTGAAGAAGAASLPWPAVREGAAATELQLDLGGFPQLERLSFDSWGPFIAPAHTPEVGRRQHFCIQAP